MLQLCDYGLCSKEIRSGHQQPDITEILSMWYLLVFEGKSSGKKSYFIAIYLCRIFKCLHIKCIALELLHNKNL